MVTFQEKRGGEMTKSGRLARRLFRVRRAEQNLMSYERTGAGPAEGGPRQC